MSRFVRLVQFIASPLHVSIALFIAVRLVAAVPTSTETIRDESSKLRAERRNTSDQTSHVLRSQWENPNDVLSVLLIIGGDVLQKYACLPTPMHKSQHH
jgi:hypothetical protein